MSGENAINTKKNVNNLDNEYDDDNDKKMKEKKIYQNIILEEDVDADDIVLQVMTIRREQELRTFVSE